MGSARAHYEAGNSGERPLFISGARWRSSCYAIAEQIEGSGLTYFSNGIEKTQIKRDQKSELLESVRAGRSEPSHGMTKEEAVTMLIQDIADYDQILARFRGQDHG
jgi:hypothetical protein